MAEVKVLTRKAKEIQTGRMFGGTPTQAEPKFLAIGLNLSNLSAAVTDVALFAETSDARGTCTASQQTTTFTNDTIQWVGSVIAGAEREVKEVALFDASTKPAQGEVETGAGVIGSAVSVELKTKSAFTPGNNNYIQIRTEVMKVTAGSGTTSLTVERAQNGSGAISTIAASDVITVGEIPGQTGISGGGMLMKVSLTVPVNVLKEGELQATLKYQYT